MWWKHIKFTITCIFTTLALLLLIPPLLLTHNFKVNDEVIRNITDVYKEFAEDIYTK